MSGLYTHITRATGLTLTASIYNADHNNHITNHIMTKMDDYSTNIAQMQTTTAPYPGDVESLATTAAGEIERIRYILLQLSQRIVWYDDPPVFRCVCLKVEPGATPNTNIDITDMGSDRGWNVPTITDATDLAASGSSGSFALNAGGTIITMDITPNIEGITSISLQMHTLNSASTSEMYVPWAEISSNNLTLALIKRGAITPVDLRTVLDASDRVEIMIGIVTDG